MQGHVSVSHVQAIWIGFAPIQSDVMKELGVSATYVNFLSLVFMIATCLKVGCLDIPIN